MAYITLYFDAKGRLDLQQVDGRCRKLYEDLTTGNVNPKRAIKDFKNAMNNWQEDWSGC